MESNEIKLNIGGKIIETTANTISKSGFLTALVNRWTEKNTIPFIDIDPSVFKHAISFMRNDLHKVPIQYKYILDYLDIKHTDNNLDNTKLNILNTINTNICDTHDLILESNKKLQEINKKLKKLKNVSREKLNMQKLEKNICFAKDCYEDSYQEYYNHDCRDSNYCKQHQ